MNMNYLIDLVTKWCHTFLKRLFYFKYESTRKIEPVELVKAVNLVYLFLLTDNLKKLFLFKCLQLFNISYFNIVSNHLPY